MKSPALVFLCLFVTGMLSAQVEYLTISTTKVGPGAIHKKIIVPSKPWEMDVLEVDLSNPYLSVESAKAKNRVIGTETVSAIAAANSMADHQIVGAINADFFNENGSINAQVVNGELIKTENINPAAPKYWSTFGLDINKKPMISLNKFAAKIIAGYEENQINEINISRGSNQLIMYNTYFGSSTTSNSNGVEVLIKPNNGWLVNDTLLCQVQKIEIGQGGMEILPGMAVLSGSGIDSTFLHDNLNVGEHIKIYIGLENALPRIAHLVGGFPRIVKNGQNYTYSGYAEEGGSASFHTDRHPRTAVGFSTDSTKVFFVTVDGRQDHSIGINLIDLADFMIEIGAAHAVNLDGGGSTAMLVRDEIKNSPSDGNERSVANALLAVSSAPTGLLSSIQMEPDNFRLFRGQKVRFAASGWDEYFSPSEIETANVNYEVDETLGSVNQDGLLTAEANGGSGFVYANYNGLKDSAYVYIKAITDIALYPVTCVIDTIQSLTFSVQATDEDGLKQNIEPDAYEWQVLNPAVATMDESGILKGTAEGTTKVVVQYADISDTAEVRIEIGSGRAQLDVLDSKTNWRLSGENIDTVASVLTAVDTPRTAGQKAFKVDYEFTRLSTARSTIYLDTDIPVYGVPEFIEFDIKSDGYKHKGYVIASDNDDEWFKSSISGYAQDASKYDTLTAKTGSFRAIDGSGTFNFPIRIRSLWVKLGTSADIGQINKGTLLFDNLRIRYPEVTQIVPLLGTIIPDKLQLEQNYPNPFNPVTTIRYQLPENDLVDFTVYNSIGQKVRTLLRKKQAAGYYSVRFDASQLASGLYFYSIKTSSDIQTKKMLLLK